MKPLPQGVIWRTINGARVAIKGGKVVAGAGGRMSGQMLPWYDDMGPMPPKVARRAKFRAEVAAHAERRAARRARIEATVRDDDPQLVRDREDLVALLDKTRSWVEEQMGVDLPDYRHEWTNDELQAFQDIQAALMTPRGQRETNISRDVPDGYRQDAEEALSVVMQNQQGPAVAAWPPFVDVQDLREPSMVMGSYQRRQGAPGTLELRQGMDPQTARNTIFHEHGHHVEFSNPGVHTAAWEFLDKRREGMQLRWNRYGFPKSSVFHDPYAGRIYLDRGGVRAGTEITSTAIQLLSNETSARKFLVNDQEHFLFGVAVLRGSIKSNGEFITGGPSLARYIDQ